MMRLGHNDGVRANLLPAPPGLFWHRQDEGVPMLDDPEQTERLLAALKAAIPFEAGVSPEALRQLRARESGSTWAARRSSTRCPISATWVASSAISGA